MCGKCPSCGYEMEDEDIEDDMFNHAYNQNLADELVEEIITDPEVNSVNVTHAGHSRAIYEITTEVIRYLPSEIPPTLRGMRHRSECCYIVSEDLVAKLREMETCHFSGNNGYTMKPFLKEDPNEKDVFGNPLMFINDYQVCHTNSPTLKSVLMVTPDNYQNEEIPVMIFVNLEAYKFDGNEKAAVRLVFPKRETSEDIVKEKMTKAKEDMERGKPTIFDYLMGIFK